jgi:crotonobetainyl-CoA:carnitine CoA-transferase CaiB-like acyl-CoA transferase
MGPLAGTRVLEVASMISGPYAASFLGSLGADVVKVEDLQGDPLRVLGPRWRGQSALFMSVNRNKRSIALNLADPGAREIIARLVERSDVLITNVQEPALSALGISYDQASKVRPDIVWVAITAWGKEGPYAGRPGIDPLAQSLSGLASLNGGDAGRPSRVPAPIIDMTTALLAVIGALVGLQQRNATGSGQRVDTSLLEAALCLNTTSLGSYLLTGWVHPRTANRSPYFAPSGIFRCADGSHVFLSAPNDGFFRRLCEALGIPLYQDERFKDMESRLAHVDELEREIQDICNGLALFELLERCARYRALAAPVLDIPQVVQHPQVLANDSIVEVVDDSGVTFRGIDVPLRRGWADPAPPAIGPEIGQHSVELLLEHGYSSQEVARFLADGLVRAPDAAAQSRPL